MNMQTHRLGSNIRDFKIANASVVNFYAIRMAKVGLHMSLLILLIACAPIMTTVRQHPDFSGRIGETKTVMLLTPDVEVYQGTFSNNISSIIHGSYPESINIDAKQMPEEAKQLAGDLSLYLVAELSKHGFEVKGGQVQDPKSHDLTDSRVQTTDLKRMYEQLKLAMYRGEMTVTKAHAYQYSLGSEAIALANKSHRDSLIFARLRVFERPGTDIAKEAGIAMLAAIVTAGLYVPPRQPSGWAELQVTFVDGKTGDVLWGNKASKISLKLTGQPNFRGDLKKMVADVFKPFSR